MFSFTKSDVDHIGEDTDDSDEEYSKVSKTLSPLPSPSCPPLASDPTHHTLPQDSDDESEITTSTVSSPTSSDSSVSTQTSASSTVRPEISLSVYHSQSHRKSKFLGYAIIPIQEILDLDPGIILKKSLPLQPKRGQSHKHVGGHIEFNIQSGSIHELLSKILKDDGGNSSSNILKKSQANRTRNQQMSEKIDSLLDTHWNKLESKAAERVDKQLVEKGLVTIVEPKTTIMSYIEQVMTGINAYNRSSSKAKVRSCEEQRAQWRHDKGI